MILFTKQTDGSFAQSGAISTKYGQFQWFDGQHWQGGWAVEPIKDLMERMQLSGPYRYTQYRILPAKKPALPIYPRCPKCNIPEDIHTSHTVTQEDIPVLPIDLDYLESTLPDGRKAPCRCCRTERLQGTGYYNRILKWWDDLGPSDRMVRRRREGSG